MLCCILGILVTLNLGQHLCPGKLVHLDAEVDESHGTDTSNRRINSTTEGEGLVDTMSKDRDEEDTDSSTTGMVNEMVEGVVITHQYGKGIVPRNC